MTGRVADEVGPGGCALDVVGIRVLRRQLGADGVFAPVGGVYVTGAIVNVAIGCACLAWLIAGPDDAWQLLNGALSGFIMVHLGFVAHEAGHGAVFRKPRLDRALAWLYWNLLTGLSGAWWRDKHGRHHRHTNDPGLDADFYPMLSYTRGEARSSRGLKRVIARHQRACFVPLLLATRAYFQLLSLGFVVVRPRLWWRELPLLLAHHSVFTIAPFLVLDVVTALGFVLIGHAVSGLYMGMVFVPNHVGMPLVASDGSAVPWRQQAAITRNIHTGPLGDWLWGGLNYQIEHHLFPDIPRHRLRKARAQVREFCRSNGIHYTSTTPMAAWRDVLEYLHAVGVSLREEGTSLDARALGGGKC